MEIYTATSLNITDLTGELEDRHFVVTRGDARIAIQIARNEYTVKLGRYSRFLVDDPDTPHKMSFTLTKPLKVGMPYNQQGVFKFVLQETTATKDDNHELGIADYYKHFPRPNDYNLSESDEDEKTKEQWL